MDAAALRATAAGMARRLQAAGHVAYFAGGCVRDELLGREPHDYDIATDATPPEVLQLFPRAQYVGAHFGVVVVHEGGEMFEIATFRTDGSYRDGRRPESVTFATPQEDAQRRDFTVNGMFLDPADGRVIDYVGGRADLQARVLRAIGDPVQRFREDRLRLMRAVRFAASLEYDVAESTWAALCGEAESLREISIERVRDEFVRILMHRNRLRGFDLLDASGLLRIILPEMEALKGCSQPPEFHPEGDVWTHTRLMLSLLPEEVSLPLVLSVLLHDSGKPATRTLDPAEGRIRFNGHDRVGAAMAESILARLKFPNQIISAVVSAVANHMKFMHVQEMRPAKVRRWLAEPGFADELELHRVDCLGSNGLLDNWEFMRTKLAESAETRTLPAWLVSGRDLLAAGYASGPHMAVVLRDVHDAQLDGLVSTKDEALAWVRSRHPL